MVLWVKILAGVSLSAFTIATLIGFADPDDPNTFWSKLAIFIKKILKWKRLNKRYALTRIGISVAFALGIVTLVFS